MAPQTDLPPGRTPGFVHLHTHSEYSLLDGMGQVPQLVAAARDAGQDALAITDHGTLAGAWKFAHACKSAGIKPILGMEAYLAIGSRFDPQVLYIPRDADVDGGEDGAAGTKRKANQHLTLLAASPEGWTNLVKLSNAAQETFFGKPLADLDLLEQHAAGLIVLTGCLGGPVAGPAARGDMRLAEANLLRLCDAVGHDNVYVEIMDHGIGAESAVLMPLARLAEKHGLTLVATNDAHFLHDADSASHEVWLASQSKTTLASENRFRFTGEGYHLRTEQEMRGLRPASRRWQDACSASVEIAGRCNDRVLPEPVVRLPRFGLPDGFDDEAAYLHHLVIEGARRRYGTPLPESVKARLTEEFEVISSLGFCGYFLIVWEMVDWARRNQILVGPGRGSAAGSLVSFCLRITDIDPLTNHLLFERFLEPGRTDMPDIDVDFEQRRIPEVHEHLRQLYGSDCVARLGTFQMARSKRAIRDVARVLGYADAGARLAAAVPVEQGKPLQLSELCDPVQDRGQDRSQDGDRSQVGADFRRIVDGDSRARKIVDHARVMENAVLGAGIHACGVIVSDRPLRDLVPLRKDRHGSAKNLPAEQQPWVSDWDGKDTEAYGLLKLDALFLRSLDVLAETSRIIAETTGERVDFARVPELTDTGDIRVRKTWELLREGRTSSVFQMEGDGMRDLLVAAGPDCLDDLSAVSALYRPGPMSAGMGERFVERRNGREAVDYSLYTDDPDEQAAIARVLDETAGTLIFQEQLMRLGTVVAGFDAAGRAKLRRAVGKKKADLMAEVGEAFMAGAGQEVFADDGRLVSPRFSRATAERLWDMFKGAASYAFNKSHSSAYGQVTFLTAYAKANWPAQTAAAVLACTDDDDKRRRVLTDLRADGIEVAAPDINQGRATTSVDRDGRLRLGLAEIRDVGKAADLIIAEREARGPFTSLADLRMRLDGRPVSSKVLEALIEAGALDAFGSRLGLMMTVRADADLTIDAEWGVLERSERQLARIGIRIGDHPLARFHQQLKQWRTDDGTHHESGTPLGRKPIGVPRLLAKDLDETGQPVLVAGVLTRWDRKTIRSGTCAVFDLEGSDGRRVEGMMWNKDLRDQERRGVPALGSAVAVDGWATRRRIEVRGVESDGADVDARDNEASPAARSNTVDVVRLRADTMDRIHLLDPRSGDLPAAPRIDLADALEKSRALVAAQKRSRHTAQVRRAGVAADRSKAGVHKSSDASGDLVTGSGEGVARLVPAGQTKTARSLPEPAELSAGPEQLLLVLDSSEAGRQMLVTLSGGRCQVKDGAGFRAKHRLGSRIIGEARDNPLSVCRCRLADDTELFLAEFPLDDLPDGWPFVIFDAIGTMPFGPFSARGTDRISVSNTPLEPAALSSPMPHSALEPELRATA